MKTLASFAILNAAAAAVHHSKTVPMTNIIDAVWHGNRKQTAIAKSTASDGWKHDCGQLVPAFGRNRKLAMVQEGNPGAGMNPDETVPFVKVLKDGFHLVDCVKDAMYEHGDKFGNNKFQYKMQDVSNSSIVHYADTVPKEDQEKMSPSVCFEFCRGLEDMVFFGISNGRDCYCTSYYKPMASDSSSCDSVCEGETSQMCGGKSKNSIWSMHMCDTMEEDMKKALEDGEAVHFHLDDMCTKIKGEAEAVGDVAADMQKHFGNLGDPAASNLLQKAKVFSGDWIHKADDCLKHVADLDEKVKDAEATKGNDFTKYDERKAAEGAVTALHDVTVESGHLIEELVGSWAEAQPQATSEIKYLPAVLAQYYSVMYFIDKEFEDDSKFPVTCDGDMLGEPLLGARPEDCALACDGNMECVGFTALAQKGPKRAGYTCFLFSKFTAAQYYTGCEGDKEESLLQLRGSTQKHNTTHDLLGGFSTYNFRAGKSKCERRAESAKSTTCEQKRSSSACQAARQETAEQVGHEATDHCFLLPDQAWVSAHIPAYANCLTECCEDYDPERIFVGFTCADVINFQDCPMVVDSYVPPGCTVANICPQTCSGCDAEAAEPVPALSAPPIPEEIHVEDLSNVVIVEREVTPLKTNMQAMCRGKFSKLGSVSLKPDPSGKSSFALKELTKADRCTHD